MIVVAREFLGLIAAYPFPPAVALAALVAPGVIQAVGAVHLVVAAAGAARYFVVGGLVEVAAGVVGPGTRRNGARHVRMVASVLFVAFLFGG